MSKGNRLRAWLLLGAVACLAGATLQADEGFWPFNGVPRAAIKKAYGFEVTDEWLGTLQLASVRFGGASGSFVSPDGLVLTNHHVGLGTLQKLSTATRDLVKNGFLAKRRADELAAPDIELNVLVSMENVTARVNAAAASASTPAASFAARRAVIADIEQESTTSTGLKSEVVTLYQGGLYHLYRYKKYTDVRLVFAPEFDSAFFGGDPDNFTYPRYCLDITLFRVYEDGKPARTDQYLRWSPNGATEGELVFTSGHPGATQRLNTSAHLEYLRDHGLPLSLRALENRRAALVAYAARGAEQQRQVKDEFFGVENGLKSLRGQLAGLKDPALMRKKQAADQALQKTVAADASMQTQYGGAWESIAKARAALPAYAAEQALIEGGSGFTSRLFSIARTLVRLGAEDAKPDTERLPEFTTARRSSLERQLFSPAPIYPAAEQAKLAASLTLMRDLLGADHEVVKIALAGSTPEARAAELVTGTKLIDVAARRALATGGRDAVENSVDRMVALARAIDPAARALRTRYENEVVSVERQAYAQIAQAVFATHGTSAYPDATSTLRLSYGAVQGYTDDGKPVPPFTIMAGLFERQATHDSEPPYDAPQSWDAAKPRLNLQTPLNLVTTNDIVGGNSGSPLVNRRGELVGIAFDGNIQSLPGYFIYDGTVNRTVSVDSRAIIEALRVVYRAGALVEELLGAQAAVPTAKRSVSHEGDGLN